jgi:hypothetical protein
VLIATYRVCHHIPLTTSSRFRYMS